MTISTIPSIYKNGFFKKSAKGILPYEVDSGITNKYSIQTLTWEDLTDMLFIVRDDTTTFTPVTGLTGFQANYLAYLEAVVSNNDYTNYLVAMNEIMTAASTQLVSCSAFKTVHYYLLNSADIIRASSDSTLVGMTETGVCTENIVAQTSTDTVANCARESSQFLNSDGNVILCYYAAVSMGSLETNSEYPTNIIKIVASYTEGFSNQLKTVTCGPEYNLQNLPFVPIVNTNSYFLIQRHGGRKANSVTTATYNNVRTSLLDGLTVQNEWLPTATVPGYPTVPTTNSSTVPGVYTEPNGSLNTNVWAPVDSGDTRPLTAGGFLGLQAFYSRLKNYLPKTYTFQRANATLRTVQTASTAFSTLGLPSPFSITNYNVGAILTTTVEQTNDYVYMGSNGSQGTKGTSNTSYGTKGKTNTASMNSNGLEGSIVSKTTTASYNNGWAFQTPVPKTNLLTCATKIIQRWFDYQSVNDTNQLEFDVVSNFTTMVDWILQQYIDGGQWVTSDATSPNYLSPEEYTVLLNVYFSTCQTAGSNLWNSIVTGNTTSSPNPNNMYNNLLSWFNQTGTYANGGNGFYTAHDTTISALLSALNISLVSHMMGPAVYPVSTLIIFERSISNGSPVVKGWAYLPNPNEKYSSQALNIDVSYLVSGTTASPYLQTNITKYTPIYN
jgi:hypothetical protein